MELPLQAVSTNAAIATRARPPAAKGTSAHVPGRPANAPAPASPRGRSRYMGGTIVSHNVCRGVCHNQRQDLIPLTPHGLQPNLRPKHSLIRKPRRAPRATPTFTAKRVKPSLSIRGEVQLTRRIPPGRSRRERTDGLSPLHRAVHILTPVAILPKMIAYGDPGIC